MSQVQKNYTDIISPLGLQMSVWSEWEFLTDVDAGGIGSFCLEEWIDFGISKGLTDKQIHEEFENKYGRIFENSEITDLSNYEESFNVEIGIIQQEEAKI
jgi:hypothetical protein